MTWDQIKHTLRCPVRSRWRRRYYRQPFWRDDKTAKMLGVAHKGCPRCGQGASRWGCTEYDPAVLPEYDKRVRAEALRQAADDWAVLIVQGKPMMTGAAWLRARANAEEANDG